MRKTARNALFLLAALSLGVTSSADNNYYATCASDPAVGALRRRSSGKVKGHVLTAANRQGCRIGCTRMLRPVCGSDGTTYGNECALCAAACRERALYLACRGECPCPLLAATGADAAVDGGGGGEAVAPSQQLQQRPNPDSTRPEDSSARKRPKKLKKNLNPVIAVTNLDLAVTSGPVTAGTLNRVTLDLRAELAPESSPARVARWQVELYHKARGQSPRLGLLGPYMEPGRGQPPAGPEDQDGGPAHAHSPAFSGVAYQLDLRGRTCADAARLCAHLTKQLRLRGGAGKRRAKVVGRPKGGALRRCVKLKCQTAGAASSSGRQQ